MMTSDFQAALTLIEDERANAAATYARIKHNIEALSVLDLPNKGDIERNLRIKLSRAFEGMMKIVVARRVLITRYEASNKAQLELALGEALDAIVLSQVEELA